MRFTLKNTTDAPVETVLFGWLENAVCLHNRQRPGTRKNRILRSGNHSFLECSADDWQARPDPRPDIVFEDWSRESYEGWTTEGTTSCLPITGSRIRRSRTCTTSGRWGLPCWFLDRTFGNASTLATGTSHRFGDDKFWGWEGEGCCPGTCTHVWLYEQTLGRIFPELDINLRERTDFNPDDGFDGGGGVLYRGAKSFVCIDGQAGIPLRCLRAHQASPCNAFLKRNWPSIKMTIEWLMEQDFDNNGILDKTHNNTLDSTWHGEVPWLNGLYLAACRAGEVMARWKSLLQRVSKSPKAENSKSSWREPALTGTQPPLQKMILTCLAVFL